MGIARRSAACSLLLGLVLTLTPSTAFADDPCLGIDANGDGAIDQLPPGGSDCLVVPLLVEPEKNNIVDLAFITVHAAVIWTPSFEPARIADVPLCFGDADVHSNRDCVPVSERGKFRDVNGDGHKDKIWKWETPQTGIQGGDTSACVYGQTTDGFKVEGCDTMTVINGPSSPSLSVNDASVFEGDSGTATASFTVTLSQSSASSVSVSYATADGSAVAPDDYLEAAASLTFSPGQTVKTVGVTVKGDADIEVDETFTLQLSGATGATIADGSGLGTILTDDAASAAAINDVTLSEGNAGSTLATFSVSIVPAAPDPVSVTWATADGSAIAPADYEASSGTLSFGAGEASKTVSIVVNGDTAPEPSEVFYVDIASSEIAVADGRGAGTIVNDDATPSISISNVALFEGNSGTSFATFVVSLSTASTGSVSVSFVTADYRAQAPADYAAASGTVTFTPGEVSKNIQILINGDTITERDESFNVNLSNPVGATISDAQGACLIKNDDG
ncbi:MAG: Calx-beta domain-containing protein [Actinomycetota bacterium]